MSKPDTSLQPDTPLQVGDTGHVRWWTLNLPDQRNPITGADMVEAITSAAQQADADAHVRCIVLTGAGPAFSSGGNIKDMAAGRGYFGADPATIAAGYRDGIQAITRAMTGLRKPIVAAVNGPAIGAGCDLAMMCDLRIASEAAVFAESFVKLGLIPGDGGAWLLPRIIGHARASEMALTGDPVDATTAMQWGMVSAVVAPDDLHEAAQSLAERVARNPPIAVQLTKALLRDAGRQSLDQVLQTSAAMQAITHHTNDHHTALTNMLQRLDEPYEGR